MLRPETFIENKATDTPLLNYVESVTSQVDFSDYAQITRKKRLLFLVLRTPELAGMLWDIAEDIVGKFDFIPVNGGNGRTRILNSKRWTRNVKFRDVLLSQVFDTLASGEGFTFLGANFTQMQEEFEKMKKPTLMNKLHDESFFNPMFKPIATSTVTVDHNDKNLVRYTQRLSGKEIKFNLREVVHLFFRRLSGKVEGFTSVSTIPLQLELLWLLWTNQYDLQAKGNMPDMFVVAQDIRSNTPAIKDLEQKLKKYNMPGNSKHGTTVLYGGKYDFQTMEKDTGLQFEEVGKAVTSVMATLFRYPKHRLAWMPKETASAKDSQGNGDRDYWTLIGKWQEKVAEIYDTQVFEPFFGTQIVFDMSYKHDSVVENTAMRSRIDNMGQLNNMMRQHGEQIPKEDVLRFVQGKNIDFKTEKIPEEDMMMDMQMPMTGSSAKPIDNQLSAEKKLAADNMKKNTGSPSGV